MKRAFFFFLWVALLFGLGGTAGWRLHEAAVRKGCVNPQAPIVTAPLQQEDDRLTLKPANAGVLRLIAVGDTGSGDADQRQVAAAMKQVCAEKGCDAVLYLGDNLYPDGAPSLQDPLFQSHFESVYAELELPFLAVLGNHDVHQPALHEVSYTAQSAKWKLPAPEYSVTAGPVELHALNTNCPAAWTLAQKVNAPPRTPWTLVFAHHPVYSAGTHGDADAITRMLANSLLSDRVDFYLSGHDHHLAHLQFPGVSTDFIVSGAGGKHYRDTAPEELKTSQARLRFQHLDTGFVWLQFDAQQAQVEFFDAQARSLYAFSKEAP